jgi:hypothetical protein
MRRFLIKLSRPLKRHLSAGAAHMIKILLTVAVLVSVGGFANPAMAQDQQSEAFGSDMSSQCAHRRVMAPNLRDGCIPKLRSDAQPGYGQGQLGYGQGQLGYRQGRASASNSDQRDEEQPQARHEQPKVHHEQQPTISTSPKVAAVPAPKAKKANTPPRPDAQREQQLYQEFLEWRNRRLFFESTP